MDAERRGGDGGRGRREAEGRNRRRRGGRGGALSPILPLTPHKPLTCCTKAALRIRSFTLFNLHLLHHQNVKAGRGVVWCGSGGGG